MNTQVIFISIFALAGVVAATFAVVNERQMQQHRQSGVTYSAVTFRRDGGWKRAELFTARGLEHQAQAARFGVAGAVLWVVALLS